MAFTSAFAVYRCQLPGLSVTFVKKDITSNETISYPRGTFSFLVCFTNVFVLLTTDPSRYMEYKVPRTLRKIKSLMPQNFIDEADVWVNLAGQLKCMNFQPIMLMTCHSYSIKHYNSHTSDCKMFSKITVTIRYLLIYHE